MSQDNASGYEKAVFDAVSYFISPDRDDDVAVDLHSTVHSFFLTQVHFFFLRPGFSMIGCKLLTQAVVIVPVNVTIELMGLCF